MSPERAVDQAPDVGGRAGRSKPAQVGIVSGGENAEVGISFAPDVGTQETVGIAFPAQLPLVGIQ
ncbi:hypothetical protein D9M68_952460 [compost metagenome]